MMKTAELLELTDEDLLTLVGTNVVIRIALRSEDEPASDEETEPTEARPFKQVVSVGTLLELQFSEDTGAAIAYMYSGSNEPDEMRWDCDEYRADFSWGQG